MTLHLHLICQFDPETRYYSTHAWEGEDPWVVMTDEEGYQYMLNKNTGETGDYAPPVEENGEVTEDTAASAEEAQGAPQEA